MGERKEDSVLLALSELKKIQEDRRQEEEDEERRKQDDLRLAREAEVKKAQDEEERKKREAEEKIRREAEEKARLEREERIHIAAQAERGRAEAEVKARHEMDLHQATLEAKHKKVPWVPIGIVGAIVVAGAAWMVLSGKAREDEKEAMLVRQAEELRRQTLETERLQAEIEQSVARTKELERQLGAAQTEEDRAKIRRQIADEGQRQQRIRRTSPSGRSSTPPAKKGIKIDDGDDPLGGLK